MATIYLLDAEGSLNVGLAASYEGASLPTSTDDVVTRGGTARLHGTMPEVASFRRTPAHTGPLDCNLTIASGGTCRIDGGSVQGRLAGTLRDLTITAPGEFTLYSGSASMIALGGASRVRVATDFAAPGDLYTGQSTVIIEPYGGGGTATVGDIHIGGGAVFCGREFANAMVFSAPIGSLSAPRLLLGRFVVTDDGELDSGGSILMGGGLVDYRSSVLTVASVEGEAGIFTIEHAPGDVTVTARTRNPNVEFREGPTNTLIDGGTPDEFGSKESLLS